MKVIGFIPARFESSRFPGKPLANILGKPMIQRVYENASKVKSIDKVMVLTDDDRIINAVQGFGGEVINTSKNISSGTERIFSVLDKFSSYDAVVNIQGDEPLVDLDDINKTIMLLKENENADIATLARIIKSEDAEDPNIVKVVVDKDSYALYFSRSKIPYVRDKNIKIDYKQHIGLYVYRYSVIQDLEKLNQSILEQSEKLEQLRFIENGYKIKVAYTSHELIGVDAPEHIKLVEAALKNMNNKN